jgi:hypothetical protein
MILDAVAGFRTAEPAPAGKTKAVATRDAVGVAPGLRGSQRARE